MSECVNGFPDPNGWRRGISSIDRLADVHTGYWALLALACPFLIAGCIGAVWLMSNGEPAAGVPVLMATGVLLIYTANALLSKIIPNHISTH